MDRRCLIVTYYFPPTGGGGVQRITKLIKYARQADWRITVITAEETDSALPYDESLSREVDAGVEVLRLPANVAAAKSYFLRRLGGRFLSNYAKRWISALLYIPDVRKTWIPRAEKAIKQKLSEQKYDCILISSPPYSLAMLAGSLQKELNIPVILDMRDPWTTNPYKIFPTPYHLMRERQLEKKAIEALLFGVSAYRTLINHFQKTIGNFSAQDWRVIPNGYDEDDFEDIAIGSKNDKQFSIAFSGTFYSHFNNPKFLFAAISGLKKDGRDRERPVHFYHIGHSALDLKKLAGRYGITDRVHRAGYLKHKECLKRLSEMDALCFILDNRHRNSGYTIGGKVYEYLRLKKPVLAMVPAEGEAAELIRETDAGTVVPSGDIKQISRMLQEWSLRDPQYSFRGIGNFDRAIQAKQFLEFINEAINKKKS